MRRKPESSLQRVKRLFTKGAKWTHVYWKQVFADDGREVNAAAVPVYMLQRVEKGEASVDDVVRALSRTSSRELAGSPDQLEATFRPLWDEAVTYVLGVRQDILRAAAAADFALQQAEQEKWPEAFKAAAIAAAVERDHSGNPTHWGPFLDGLAEVLVTCGYVRDKDALRSFAQAPARTEDTGPARPGRDQ